MSLSRFLSVQQVHLQSPRSLGCIRTTATRKSKSKACRKVLRLSNLRLHSKSSNCALELSIGNRQLSCGLRCRPHELLQGIYARQFARPSKFQAQALPIILSESCASSVLCLVQSVLCFAVGRMCWVKRSMGRARPSPQRSRCCMRAMRPRAKRRRVCASAAHASASSKSASSSRRSGSSPS